MIKQLAAIGFALGMMGGANANSIVQKFESSWSRSVWDYYGDIAAMQWHYLPYIPWDSSQGTLNKVTVETSISGIRENPAEAVRIRNSFFTGWNPASYQFYEEYQIGSGQAEFSSSTTRSYAFDLSSWTVYPYFSGVYVTGQQGGAWYYFESRTVSVGHSISATTTLTYFYQEAAAIPVPGTLALLGLGLVGLARRSRSTGQRVAR
jgi:hypothetical protein